MPDYIEWFKKFNLPLVFDIKVPELLEKNSKRIDFKKLEKSLLKEKGIKTDDFFKLLVKEILKASPEVLGLLRDLCVIDPGLETNIDRKSVVTSYDLPDVEKAFNELVDTGLIKKKEGTDVVFEFTLKPIQDVFDSWRFAASLARLQIYGR